MFTSHNPATQEVLWTGNCATQADINKAVERAQKSYPVWSALTLDERSLYLNRFAETLDKEYYTFAEIISKETGKPLWESKNEVKAMIHKVALSLEAYGSRCAGIIHEQPLGRTVTRHHPIGVIGILGPFNFPGHLPSGHIIPALLAGNTIVFKPSELTPLVGEALCNVWNQAGLPNGVLNLVQGGAETGQALAKHDGIKGLFFTGSYKVGKWLAEQLGPQPQKILVLEMGGNNPLVVGALSNPKAAAFLTIQSAYITTGQRCTCARRLIVIKNETSQAFMDCLQEMIGSIIVGAYTDVPEPYMGPIIAERYASNILKAQDSLEKQGGIPLIKMRQLRPDTPFLSPGLMDVTSIKNRPDEEIFGPFLQVIQVKDLNEAIKEANNTKFGLSAGILTYKQDEYDQFYRNIRAGIINWNAPLTGASSAAPFGGVECSGNFRPSAYYAADYCSYPVASTESVQLKLPPTLPPGITI